MKLIYQWTPTFLSPPRWMAFAYYSAMRNRTLFVAFPLNLLVALAWWAQDKCARHSWIENEIRRRMDARQDRGI